MALRRAYSPEGYGQYEISNGHETDGSASTTSSIGVEGPTSDLADGRSRICGWSPILERLAIQEYVHRLVRMDVRALATRVRRPL